MQFDETMTKSLTCSPICPSVFMKNRSKDLEGKKHHFGASGTNTPQPSRKTSAEFRMAAPEGEAISMCKPSDKVCYDKITLISSIDLSLRDLKINLLIVSFNLRFQ